MRYKFFLHALFAVTFGHMCAPPKVRKHVPRTVVGKTFFRNYERNQVPEMSLCKTRQFIFLQGIINFQFVIFESIATHGEQHFIPKGCFLDEMCRDTFLVLNLSIICIKPFICNNTIFSVSFLKWNIISPLNIFFKKVWYNKNFSMKFL